jgi:hypothetical protein
MLRLSQGLGILLIVTAVSAQAPERPPGGTPGGPLPGFRPFELPQPGQIFSTAMQEQLKLTAEQKKQLAEAQKEVDGQVAKILSADQKKTLQDIRSGKGGPQPGKGFGPPPGGFGGGTPAPSRGDDVKKVINATDEEWKVLGPKFQKLLSARRLLNADDVRPAGPFGGGENSALTQAQAELKATLADPKHTKEEVGEKIAAVRKARQTARASLEAAQKDLLQLLTAQQEATLKDLGYLE